MSEKVEKMLELTPKQQKFVDIFIEKGHLQTAKQCALDAGYSESTATVTASALQNPKYYPHVVEEARDPLPKTLKLFSGSIVRDPSSISEKHPLCSIGPGSKSQGWEQLLLMLGAWTPDGRSSTKLH
jgi:hypothetical protein